MLTNWKPWEARPLLSIQSAAARTFASSTDAAHTFHEFHPSGGVSAMARSPATMVSVAVAVPFGPLTVTTLSVRPALASVPLMTPVAASSDTLGATTIIRNGMIDMSGTYEVLRKLIQTYSTPSPKVTQLMTNGDYEVGGIFPNDIQTYVDAFGEFCQALVA